MALYPSKSELFENCLNNSPENKLELIDRKLVVGNSLVGSRLLLRQILQGWGAEAAIALAPIETWVSALATAYGWNAPADKPVDETLGIFESQAKDFEFVPEDLSAGSVQTTWAHHQIRQCLTLGLFRLDRTVGGRSLGRDFVMRLGNDGFTPDLVFFKGAGLNQPYSSFVSGPAELVIEVLMPGHEGSDRTQKYHTYQTAGVPEYWLIEPTTKQVEFYRLINGHYQQQPLAADSFYRPSSVPGLAFCPAEIWQEEDANPMDAAPWIVEQPVENWEPPPSEIGPKWGSLLFIPNIQMEPVPINFEEFISSLISSILF